MSNPPTTSLGTGLVVSLLLHAGLAVGLSTVGDLLTRRGPERGAGGVLVPLEPEPPARKDLASPPPEHEEEVKLGIADGVTQTETWLGFKDPTPHSATPATTDQAGLTIASGPVTEDKVGGDESPPEAPRDASAGSVASASVAIPPASAAESVLEERANPAAGQSAAESAANPVDGKPGERTEEQRPAEKAASDATPAPVVPDSTPTRTSPPESPAPTEAPAEVPAAPGPVTPRAAPAVPPVDAPDEVKPADADLTRPVAEKAEPDRPVGDAGAKAPESPAAETPAPDAHREPPASGTRPDAGSVAPAGPERADGAGDTAVKDDEVKAAASKPAEQPPTAVKTAASRPSPAAAAAPAKTTGTRPGAAGRPGERRDQSADATSMLREAVDVVPGRPAAAKGLKIKTTPPQWGITTQLISSARNPVVAITFGKNGRVSKVVFVKGMNAGAPDVDGPLLDAIHEWRAEGAALERLADRADAGITVVMRITLRGI